MQLCHDARTEEDDMLTMDDLAAEVTGVTVEDADDERVLAVLDRQARALVGMSGDAFLAAWRAGAFEDRDDAGIGRLVSTAMLLA